MSRQAGTGHVISHRHVRALYSILLGTVPRADRDHLIPLTAKMRPCIQCGTYSTPHPCVSPPLLSAVLIRSHGLTERGAHLLQCDLDHVPTVAHTSDRTWSRSIVQLGFRGCVGHGSHTEKTRRAVATH